MKHVLGMAKRSLDLNGAKGPKLELDFLRLVYVVKELRRAGSNATGYLLVMSSAIAQRVAGWQSKYEAGDAVRVGVAQVSAEQLAALQAEVQANIDGMVAGTLGQDVGGRSDASVGGELGEAQLRSLIEKHESGVTRSLDERNFPFGIRWDYYGTTNSAGADAPPDSDHV